MTAILAMVGLTEGAIEAGAAGFDVRLVAGQSRRLAERCVDLSAHIDVAKRGALERVRRGDGRFFTAIRRQCRTLLPSLI